jgi:hypothetical protein
MKKKNNGYRPYVYKRADELGIPVVEATARQQVVVTANDVVLAKKANSKHCALARSALRIPGVVAAYFFRSTAYLEFEDRLVRYALPHSVQKEIVSFDRAQIFADGVYQLSPPPPANTLAAHRRASKRLRKRRRRERAAVPLSAIASARERESSPGTPGQRAFEAQVQKILGGRTVSGVKGHRAPEPLPDRALTRYVHRTKYVRDLREPSDR